MTTDLTSRVKGLSPEALRLYKKMLPQRLKEMGEVDRNTALEQMRGMPELADLFGEEAPLPKPEKPQEPPLWQKGLSTLTAPFQWLQEKAIEPFAATVTAPFTPSVQGMQDLPYFQRELAEYKAWQAPWGVKGAIETLPWLALPSGAGIAGKLGTVARAGGALGKAAQIGVTVMKPIAVAEKVITAPIRIPLEKAGEAFAKRLALTQRFVAPANEIMESRITEQDWMRSVAQWFGRKPVLKSLTQAVGGRAATVTASAEDATARALLVGARVQETLLSKGQSKLAELRQIHPNPVGLFGVDEATGLTKIKPKVAGKSTAIADIAEHPLDYELTTMQKDYIKKLHDVEDWVKDGLKEAGVEVHEINFDEFSHWVHRAVIGKNVDDELVKILPRVSGRIGSKASWEKARFYETAADGIKGGIIYEPSLEKVVDLYVQSAAKRISDQRIAGLVEGLGKTPLSRAWEIAPQVMQSAKEVSAKYGASLQLIKTINRSIRGEKLPEVTLQSIERKFPELGNAVRNAQGKAEELKKILGEAKDLSKELKPEYWQAKAKRAEVMGVAKTPTLGTEATIMHPAFQGKIYPKDVAGAIQQYWDDMGWKPLAKLANISGEMRTLVAAADFSAMFIQGLPMIGRFPAQWAKAAAQSFKSAWSPKTNQDFLVKEADGLLERAHYGGYVGGFEFMEAVPALQRTFGTLGRVVGGKGGAGVGKEAIRQSYGRFEASFGSFGDVARNEMWKALKGRAKSEQDLMEIARHIDRMTGVMSQKGIGLGRTQRQLESSFLFFAPKYTRAGFALVGDLFKGGITGAETRKSLGSMMAAGALVYAGTAMALGQEPDFNPSSAKFMTIEIRDPVTGTVRHFGVGGMMTSLIRLGADVQASIAGTGENEPMDLVKLSRFDNPFIKFMFSKTSPVTGFMENLAFQHNYFGEPYENLGDYTKFVSDRFLPIAVQDAFTEAGGYGPTALAGGMAGMRVFPQSEWEKRDIKRDEVAQKQYGMSWKDVGAQMGELHQKQLERDNPDLKAVTEIAQERTSKTARGTGKVWDSWRKEGESVENYYRKTVELASREYEQTGDGTTFRGKVDEAQAVKRGMYSQREANPAYADVYAYFREPLDADTIKKMNIKDYGRKKYYEIMYSPAMYDQFGNYNFDEADRVTELFRQKYGQEVIDYVKEFEGGQAKWVEPSAMKALRESKRVLKPYWDIEDQIWAQYPPEYKQIADQIKQLERSDPVSAKRLQVQYPAVLWARRLIAQMRKQLKARDPQVAMALQTFYRY